MCLAHNLQELETHQKYYLFPIQNFKRCCHHPMLYAVVLLNFISNNAGECGHTLLFCWGGGKLSVVRVKWCSGDKKVKQSWSK